jgi:hypothetical protein
LRYCGINSARQLVGVLTNDVLTISSFQSVLYTDGTCFSRATINKIRSQHQWAEENPHSAKQVLPHQLTGNYYQDFLLYDLKKLMEDA